MQAGGIRLSNRLALPGLPRRRFSSILLCPSVLEFETYNSQNHDRLAQIVDATYQETLDCPKLNHVRQLEDVLEGYRATGEFSPDRWLIVRYENRDVGCLLLADHPQYENMELVYMGIIPAVRGHALGNRHCTPCSMDRPAGGPAAVSVGGRCFQSSGDQKCTHRWGFAHGTNDRVYYRIFSKIMG